MATVCTAHLVRKVVFQDLHIVQRPSRHGERWLIRLRSASSFMLRALWASKSCCALGFGELFWFLLCCALGVLSLDVRKPCWATRHGVSRVLRERLTSPNRGAFSDYPTSWAPEFRGSPMTSMSTVKPGMHITE